MKSMVGINKVSRKSSDQVSEEDLGQGWYGQQHWDCQKLTQIHQSEEFGLALSSVDYLSLSP